VWKDDLMRQEIYLSQELLEVQPWQLAVLLVKKKFSAQLFTQKKISSPRTMMGISMPDEKSNGHPVNVTNAKLLVSC
jgi:hypothetical protein